MDRLAACHAMHGFLNVHAYRRKGYEAPHKRIKAQARSLSLADRRGLITPPRNPARGIISPLPSSRSNPSLSALIFYLFLLSDHEFFPNSVSISART